MAVNLCTFMLYQKAMAPNKGKGVAENFAFLYNFPWET